MTPEQMLTEIERLRAELAEERAERRRMTETLRLVAESQARGLSPRVTLKQPASEQPDLAWPSREPVDITEVRVRELTPDERAEREKLRAAEARRNSEDHARRICEAEEARRAASRVYFIRQDEPNGLVKIGFTRRPVEKRLAELQKHHACTLVVAAVAAGLMSDERHLHDRFAHLRVTGEWFRPAEDLTAYIQLVSDRGAL